MKKQEEDPSWSKLAETVRRLDSGQDSVAPPNAPPDFVSRMRSKRRELWDLARALLWRRWSLIAVFIAIVAYLLVHVLLKKDREPSITPPKPPHLFSS